MLNSLRELFKTNLYAIVTALVLAAAITGYILVILPMQQDREDNRNMGVFRNVQEQLLGYIDDQAQAVRENRIINDPKKGFMLAAHPEKQGLVKTTAKVEDKGEEKAASVKETEVPAKTQSLIIDDKKSVIEKVEVRAIDVIDGMPGKIMLTRTITFSMGDVKEQFDDSSIIDLKPFFRQMSPLKQFDAFYICKLDKDRRCVDPPLIADNVLVRDQDSLIKYNRVEGVHQFDKSAKRYYTAQVAVAPNLSIYIAAGLSSAKFDSAVRSISPGLLIFSLLVIILLILSLSLIKPILSGYKERMSQRDFVSVAFCTGALIAVLVTFLMVTGWTSLLRDKNGVDLKRLADNVSHYFAKELDAHVNNRQLIINSKTPRFAKMEIKNNSLCFLNDSTESRCDALPKLDSFDRLDEYFTMDSTGLITSNRNKETPGIRRIYKDREYFKLLQDIAYDQVLTAVLSRRDHTYQWIYATETEDGGVSGISFRDNLSQIIKVPPGTAFLIVKGNGDILFQNDPGKVLRGNLLEGTSNDELLRLLAGNNTSAFTAEYQGIKYQMFGQKLKNGNRYIADNPIYVIAMRDLRFQESLSLFSFSNTFLITLLYGVFIMLLMMVYSATLYAGRLSVFSKQHLVYLFPDNSRTKEYRQLFAINSTAMVIITAASFMLPASIALWCCLITGVNIAFLNFALLNNNRYKIKVLLGKIAWLIALAAILAFIAIIYGYFIIALLLTFTGHFGIIAYYKKLKVHDQADDMRAKWNKGINRKYYSRFFTLVLLKHFGLLPFLLCTTIYITELNDISAWYCASTANYKDACIIEANGCSCAPKPEKVLTHADTLARRLDIGLLGRPSTAQLETVRFTDPKPISYLKTIDVLSPLKGPEKTVTLVLLFLAMSLIYLLTKGFIDYYSNRFFFFSLMQAGYEGYYQQEKQATADVLLPAGEEQAAGQSTDGPVLFSADKNLWVLHKEEFLLQEKLKKHDQQYDDIWNALPVEQQTVLFDFARDHFVNYKNRDVLAELINQQLISFDHVTGRLRVTNEVFRSYVLETYRKDPVFIAHFNKESKDGFFTKLRLPLIIIAISLLVLLMYLNKESFSELLAFGTAITTTLGMVNNLMKGNKPVG